MKKNQSSPIPEISFTKKLIHWNETGNQRVMPWKGIKDPYKIWLSEIILQQTRVDQGMKYYESFIAKYPSIHDLAKAPEDEVFRLWQGLGYYNRCRNMLATARVISNQYNGVFPNDYNLILSLKGIGAYTAAAIASFAFNLPYAVVDGNVVRVLSRIFALRLNFFDAKGKREIQEFAQKLLDKTQPGLYNQAIMDLGATICKPQSPICEECPLDSICQAYKSNQIELFPIKKVRKELKERHFHFIVLETKQAFYITRRIGKDVWKDLHTFFLIESKVFDDSSKPNWLKGFNLPKPIELSQVLSHQRIHGYFYTLRINKLPNDIDSSMFKVKKTELNNYAFPRLILSFFEKINYL